MCVRCLVFVVLLWFPEVLHAQDAAQSCPAPTLDHGYFVPEQPMYDHESTLTYACDNKHKPAEENWWAKITCQNGNWSPEPRCIDKNACFTPTIPNANYTKNQDGWYEDGNKIRITCDRGYEPKNNDVTAKCTNGTWSSVPVCEKSTLACGEPPQISHAVITRGYQEVFAVDSVVEYKCKDGYTTEGADNTKSIICVSGKWTEPPTCRPSTTPGLNDRDTKPVFTTIDQCGSPPVVLNGLVEKTLRSLTYKCNTYYKLNGPETVACYSDGTWSEVPTCEVWFCPVNTDEIPDLEPAGVKFIHYGETVELECKDVYNMKNYALAQCTDGTLTLSKCCNNIQLTLRTGCVTERMRLPSDLPSTD